MCCLFVGVAQMLWVLPVNHFFQKCIGATTPCVTCLLNLPCATTPLVLLVRGSCPIRLGADRAPLFKNAMVLQHLALPVRGSCPQSLGAAPVCYLSADVARMFWVTCFHTALVLPPLVLPKQRIHAARFRNASSVFAPPTYRTRLVACTAKTKVSHRTIPLRRFGVRPTHISETLGGLYGQNEGFTIGVRPTHISDTPGGLHNKNNGFTPHDSVTQIRCSPHPHVGDAGALYGQTKGFTPHNSVTQIRCSPHPHIGDV